MLFSISSKSSSEYPFRLFTRREHLTSPWQSFRHLSGLWICQAGNHGCSTAQSELIMDGAPLRTGPEKVEPATEIELLKRAGLFIIVRDLNFVIHYPINEYTCRR